MSFIIEMIPARDSDSKYQKFTLTIFLWEELLEVAHTNGWTGSGTLPDPVAMASNPEYMSYFKSDYKPNDWSLSKLVSREDALALSKALRRGEAKRSNNLSPSIQQSTPSFLPESASQIKHSHLGKSASELIPDFIQFLENGEFTFAVDD